MGMAALAALLSIAPATAADRVLGPAGAVHTVAVGTVGTTVNALPTVSGTKLLYRMQSTEESVEWVVIPGTEDSVADTEPAILLSPVNYRPVIVWTRNEGSEAEIDFSFYNGTLWTPAAQLTLNDYPDHSPQIYWGHSNYLHVVWSGAETPDGPMMYEAVLDSKGLVIVPPSLVASPPGPVVTTTNGAPATMLADDALFAVDTSYKQTGRVTVQGGLDEPVPVNKRVDFVLPAGNAVDSCRIRIVNGRLLLLVKSGTRMYYSYQEPTTGWTVLHSVTLDATTDEGAAETMIAMMLEGLEPQ